MEKKLTISVEPDETGQPRMNTHAVGLSLVEIIGMCEATRVNAISQLLSKSKPQEPKTKSKKS